MAWIMWSAIGVGVNALIGAVVWATIDDKQQSLLAWYKSCPAEISWFAQPLALSLWPVVLWFYLTRKGRWSGQ